MHFNSFTFHNYGRRCPRKKTVYIIEYKFKTLNKTTLTLLDNMNRVNCFNIKDYCLLTFKGR